MQNSTTHLCYRSSTYVMTTCTKCLRSLRRSAKDYVALTAGSNIRIYYGYKNHHSSARLTSCKKEKHNKETEAISLLFNQPSYISLQAVTLQKLICPSLDKKCFCLGAGLATVCPP
ncbi:hypothetical protein IscW_ISCW013987 [Ixodes scapularis]|uniref:Uncharacterized protein n=1 Tax=Ixodes scapularis TaxID=6945 RepID=B7QJG2_IXOSC|nr:hypothetical protein IscW_ISCW013987 [Ixodes scapularis]|eukprot:XP_002415319.1 hypothetical protein IscW_ISCW013987 [Ixodes scapularis]